MKPDVRIPVCGSGSLRRGLSSSIRSQPRRQIADAERKLREPSLGRGDCRVDCYRAPGPREPPPAFVRFFRRAVGASVADAWRIVGCRSAGRAPAVGSSARRDRRRTECPLVPRGDSPARRLMVTSAVKVVLLRRLHLLFHL